MLVVTRNGLRHTSVLVPDQRLDAITTGSGADYFVTVCDASGAIVGQTPVNGVLEISQEDR